MVEVPRTENQKLLKGLEASEEDLKEKRETKNKGLGAVIDGVVEQAFGSLTGNGAILALLAEPMRGVF